MAPFAWQSNTAILFDFTQNSVLRFNLVSGTEARFSFNTKLQEGSLALVHAR